MSMSAQDRASANWGTTNELAQLADTLKHYQQYGVRIGGQVVKLQFSEIAKATGISRSDISTMVNQGKNLGLERIAKIREYLQGLAIEEDAPAAEQPDAEQAQPAAPVTYKHEIELYRTADFGETLGWCRYVASRRKMGVMVGYPGSGKTTVLREFARTAQGVRYIDCWPTMIIGDLINAVASALGVNVTGTKHTKVMQIVNALQGRTDVILVFDEAENLRNWNVKSFEILRKIWDSTNTPVIFAGTPELESMLTRGSGRENLAQLYRRKYEKRLAGITASEVRGILRDYNVDPEAAAELARIAADTKHGGLGNFVEILDLSLEAAQGGMIDKGIVNGAMQYKLMY